MNLVLSINGPDNIGKTRLVEELTSGIYMKSIIEHFGPVKTKEEGRQVMLNTIKTINNCDKKFFIFDRCFMGDFVYGPLFRKYNSYSYFEKMREKLASSNARYLYIFLYADETTYDKFDLKPKKDEKVAWQKSDVAEKISIKFIELANKLAGISNVDRLVINCNNYKSLDERNEYILTRISKWYDGKTYTMKQVDDYSQTIFNPKQNTLDFDNLVFERQTWDCRSYRKCNLGKQHKEFSSYGIRFDKPTIGHGSVTPDYIFVGEAPGYLGCGTYGVPFYGDKSGYLLYDALDQLGILISQCYITNTVKCCPKGNDLGDNYSTEKRLELECVWHLDTEILAVRKEHTKVIALGTIAAKTLSELKVPDVIAIKHPAYFLYKRTPGKFVDELRRVIK